VLIGHLSAPSLAGAQVVGDTTKTIPPVVVIAEDSVPLTLSLREAIERALARNPDVLRARARVAEANALVRAARAQGRPQINAQVAYTHVFRSIFLEETSPFFPDTLDPEALRDPALRALYRRDPFLRDRSLRAPSLPGPSMRASGQVFPPFGDTLFGQTPFPSTVFPFAARDNWFVGFNFSQTLYDGGRVRAQVDAARRRAEAARVGLRQSEGDLVLAVRRAYYDAVLAEELIAIARASLRLSGAQRVIARTRRLEGPASDLDVLRAEVELENLTPQLIDAENSRTTARLDLRSLIEFPLDSALILTTGLCPAPGDSARPDHLPPPALADSLIEANPTVVAAERELEARRAEIGSARAAYRPSLSLSGNLGWQAFSGSPFPDINEWSANWFATLNFQLPLYLGGSLRANLDAARARAAQAEQDLAQQRETAREDYREALARLERAWDQVATRRRTVLAAERIYGLNQLRFREGVAIQLEVLDAATALRQARTNMIGSSYYYFLALAQTERVLDQPVEAMVLPEAHCN
jgi:outer membrane protein TolC